MDKESKSLTDMAEKSLIPVGVYQHYKGQKYQVLGTACHSETDQDMVVYRALYGDYSFWIRPLDMFCEQLNKDGEIVNRFTLVDSSL